MNGARAGEALAGLHHLAVDRARCEADRGADGLVRHRGTVGAAQHAPAQHRELPARQGSDGGHAHVVDARRARVGGLQRPQDRGGGCDVGGGCRLRTAAHAVRGRCDRGGRGDRERGVASVARACRVKVPVLRHAHQQRAHLRHGLGFDLAHALAGDVGDLADLLQREAAAVGDVEGAGLHHVARLAVGEVELDATTGRVDVQVQAESATHEWTRSHAVGAVRARGRSHVVDARPLRVLRRSRGEDAVGEAPAADGARAHLADRRVVVVGGRSVHDRHLAALEKTSSLTLPRPAPSELMLRAALMVATGHPA